MPEGIGRVGHLPEPMTITDIASLIKGQFDLENVILYGDKEKVVWKVAICPGSGKSVIRNALDLNAELLITGDIGHHEGIDAVDEGLMILDATHYGLERIFIPFLEEYLGKVLTKEIRITSVDTGSPIEIL
jgi:putative NIF3 family GTP cyclohydrolase 1 type 2